jgi:hypothetical protein
VAPKKQSSARITSKTTLNKALELIASDQFRDTDKKPVRVYLKIDPGAAKILLNIVGLDANRGWAVLRGCDAMSLYGSQIPLAFNGYCAGELEIFAAFAEARKDSMARWVDKQRETHD